MKKKCKQRGTYGNNNEDTHRRTDVFLCNSSGDWRTDGSRRTHQCVFLSSPGESEAISGARESTEVSLTYLLYSRVISLLKFADFTWNELSGNVSGYLG